MKPETVEWMKSQIPNGQLGTVESIAAISAFYLSPEAAYVTAQVIDHSGGRNVTG